MTGLWILTIVIIIIFATAAYAGLRAAPYVPTYARDVVRMLKLADVRPGELVVDLGAGDGRFLLSAVRNHQAKALGYELSILPFVVARIRIWLARVGKNASVRLRDFYSQDLSQADIVTCFLTPEAMAKLEPKFQRELKPGTRVVSYAFAMPNWKPELVDKPTPTTTSVYLYRAPGST